MLTMRAVIYGQVHGVGFRAMTKNLAQKLGLKGSVRNLPDCTVEICAQGDKQTLQKLLEQLKIEFGDFIERIDHSFIPSSENYSTFTILKD